jgi:hypothetical protein
MIRLQRSFMLLALPKELKRRESNGKPGNGIRELQMVTEAFYYLHF